MSAKPIADWPAITVDWRAGIKTKLEMSQEYGVSRQAIEKHFAKRGIERDLKAKINAKADAIVAKAAVKVTTERPVASEEEIIEANAQVVADVHGRQRGLIARLRNVVAGMLAEVDAEVANPELFEKMGELLAEESGEKLNELYRKVMSLPSRVDSVKKLSETLKILIALEREAYNIQPGADPAKQLGEKIGMSAAEAWKLSINAIS